MKKNFAFTLMEMIMVLIILGIIVTISVGILKSRNYITKSYIAKAQKAIRTVDLAMNQIKTVEEDRLQCPLATFIYKIGPEYKFAILKTDGKTRATEDDLMILFGEHIKFYEFPENFCAVTGVCSDSGVKGGSLTGDLHIGFKIYADTAITSGNCPQYISPETGALITPQSDNVCWGELYVATEGAKTPKTLGQGYYVFGLGATGVVR